MRGGIDPAVKRQWDAAVCARVLDWFRELDMPGPLGVYWPLRGEVDLAPAYQELARQGVSLALPIVVTRDAALGFALWEPGEPMETGALGVAVPAQLRMVDRPAALLIPCLGYDAAGYRLGYGGGFYDRTLAALPRPRTAGISYSFLKSDFMHQDYDIALDVILTEES